MLLGSPDHLGTAVPVLILLLLLDWAPARWYGPAAAGILLAASIVGDPIVEVVGVLPLFLGCLIRAGRILWHRRADAPAPAASSGLSRRTPRLAAWAWRTAWYELSLAAAAALAVPAGLLAYRPSSTWAATAPPRLTTACSPCMRSCTGCRSPCAACSRCSVPTSRA